MPLGQEGLRQLRRHGAVAIGVVAIGMALLVASTALSAHSFFPTHYSAKSAVSVDAEGIRAVVVIEVPTFQMVKSFREHFSDIDLLAEIEAGRFEPLEDEFRIAQLELLARDLRLTVNGGSVEGVWRPVDSPVNGRGTEGFFVYMLEFDWLESFALPTEVGEPVLVRLETLVLPEEAIVLANVAEASDGWEILESSIPPAEEYPEVPQGAALIDELGLWTADPVKRDLRVSFARVGR